MAAFLSDGIDCWFYPQRIAVAVDLRPRRDGDRHFHRKKLLTTAEEIIKVGKA
jgi:hypothetical protein